MTALGCGAVPEERGAREVQASPRRAVSAVGVVWRQAGTKVLGVDATRAFAWERAGESQNIIVATSIATGAELSRRPLEAAPYIGQPRAWWTIGEASLVHWDGVGRVQESTAVWTAGTVTRAYSTSQPAPGDTLLVADRYRVVRLRVDGQPLWTHELPRGAQPPEFFVDAATVGLALQQYSTTSPTTQLRHPAPRALHLAGGRCRALDARLHREPGGRARARRRADHRAGRRPGVPRRRFGRGARSTPRAGPAQHLPTHRERRRPRGGGPRPVRARVRPARDPAVADARGWARQRRRAW
jgi:hypothetical protein